MPPRVVTFAHSPDPDDAFMACALTQGRFDDDALAFDVTTGDVESLNRAAVGDRYDVTALSAATLPDVADRYVVLRHSASFGDGYGPVVVARSGEAPADPAAARVAIPGEGTTAYLALRLALGDVEVVTADFRAIPRLVLDAEVDLGLLIHEGQVTYADEGLKLVLDTGAWWRARTGLPLPLGVVVAHDRLGPDLPEVSARLRGSMTWGLDHREDALRYAKEFGRGLSDADADRFVAMYVSGLTRDMGGQGEAAIRRLLAEGAAAGLVKGAEVRFAD